MPALPLDAIDRQILRLLQEDGRMSMAALAERVGLTTTPLRLRVEKLREAGVIRGFHASIEPAAVSRATMAFILVTLRDHSRASHQRFVEGATAMPEVLEVHHIAGEEDFLLKVVVRDVAALEALLLERLTPIEAISRVKTTFVLSSAKSGAPIPIDDAGGGP
jgi:Lrp/AsnC family leucine-responsive transcriptional regulator